MGIPHSVFALSRVWPNPDDPYEPLWSPEDTAKALAYVEWESGRCGVCGQHRHDWYDDNGVVLEDPPFEVVEVLCPSCELLDDKRDERRETKDQRNGIHLAFKRYEEHVDGELGDE